eukprot:CAMPEP_0204637456 /NCGR_PEP_ID=MMETSP0717-20131115/36650_1 /ASSEMBLY_ACC=CAM_ASM_000666 /TAXON_ID=230516 /ORGANISM="Chaetoceros curvisetus" /LENGTH=79 /DNA_ID=CAMNT_0051656875 /DNA_START=731 /DNA_END=970 /DNA_ORIENTATION=+
MQALLFIIGFIYDVRLQSDSCDIDPVNDDTQPEDEDVELPTSCWKDSEQHEELSESSKFWRLFPHGDRIAPIRSDSSPL